MLVSALEFYETMSIESAGDDLFQRLILEKLPYKPVKITDSTRVGLSLQLQGVDYLLCNEAGGPVSVEVKTEGSNLYGNFFFELYQGVTPEVKNGWILDCQADFLVYQFLKQETAYIVGMADLRGWFFGTGAFTNYKIKPQTKRDFRNTSYGICTPIRAVLDNVEGCCMVKTQTPAVDIQRAFSMAIG